VLLTTDVPILAISLLGFSFSSAANAVTISLLLLAESDANDVANPWFGIGEGANFLSSLPFTNVFFEPGAVRRIFGTVQGTFGTVQGTFSAVQGTFGAVQGTFVLLVLYRGHQ